MSRNVGKIFVSPKPSTQAPVTNVEGYPAFANTLEEDYLQALLTNTMGNTFYASQRDLVDSSLKLHDDMLTKDPSFAAKAIVFARNEGFMRTQPIVGLAKLASVPGPLFEQTFGSVIRTPNDLMDFATIVRNLRGKSEGGRKIKRVAGKWLLNHLTEYWAIKYGADKSNGYSLRDLFCVYHPKGQHNPIVDYLFDRGVSEELTQISAFEALKKATNDVDKVKAIVSGRLPHEVASTFAGNSKEVWKAIVPQMPIFALLRNLATIERHGVMEAVVDRVVSVLTNPRAIADSKILPFRFVEAMEHVSNARVRDALRDAVDLSFGNVPDIVGKTAIFLDVSGSMRGFIQKAALFGVCAMKKANNNGRLITFNTHAHDVTVSMRDSVLTQASNIHANGGTDTSAPLQRLLRSRYKTDNIILITDDQQNVGPAWMDVLEEYRDKVKAKVKVFVVNVAPYPNTTTPKDSRGLNHFLFGWSDQVLEYNCFGQ